MRSIREVLRLKYDRGRSQRQISAAVAISRSTVSEYVTRAEKAGVSWEIVATLSDAELEERLFRHVGRNEPLARVAIDFEWIHRELRGAGVTLQLLWTEYLAGASNDPSGQRPYQYSQFCDLYRGYRSKLSPVMRQEHRAGEKAFIDFSGKRPRLFDATTGESTEVELFVMVLGASNYTYVEATRTQQLADFVGATVRGLEYFRAVPEMLVPDQLKSAVTTSDRYEPALNATYAEMGQHYATAIIPARPRKPRDKAQVEGGVLLAQRWILACLRHRRFFSLEELNAAVWELLEKLNRRPFQKLSECRRSLFESLERPAMKSLPSRRYEVGHWKLKVGVNIDYHIAYEHRHYSVPSALVGEKVDVRATAQMVEVWHGGQRVTSHERSHGPKGTAVTKAEHRPRSHREIGAWPAERLVAWAGKTGEAAAGVAGAILSRGPHPESGRRACLGLLRLGERYGTERLEAACAVALRIGNPTKKSVESVLRCGLDRKAVSSEVVVPTPMHENIRGGEYFDRGETTPTRDEAMDPDEIEARYLEDERLGIINDGAVPPMSSSQSSLHRSEESAEAGAALHAPTRSVRMPPVSLAPPATLRALSPCSSPTECLPAARLGDGSTEERPSEKEDRRRRQDCPRDATRCHVDDGPLVALLAQAGEKQ